MWWSGSGGLWGLDRCVRLGGGWTRESGGGRVRGGWTDELVYLVSVGGSVRVCERVFSVGFGPGLESISPARSVGAPPAMLEGHTAGFPQKLGGRASGEVGVGGYNLHSSPTVAHQPRAGCIRLVILCEFFQCISNGSFYFCE